MMDVWVAVDDMMMVWVLKACLRYLNLVKKFVVLGLWIVTGLGEYGAGFYWIFRGADCWI